MIKAISAPFKKGVNFTNWLEFRPADMVQEDMYTREDFENVKKLGCDVVRIPIHFETLCNPAVNAESMFFGNKDQKSQHDNSASIEKSYIIPEKIFNILDKVAEWAQELEIYVIYDFHNNTHIDSKTSNDVESILVPIWKQMAERYAGASRFIIYELMNEPHGIEISLWNDIIARLFQLVRSIDQEHYIIVGGADWNSFSAMKTLPDFNDDKVIYTFHFYDPHTFTHQGATWCHMERVIGIPFPYDEKKMPPIPENPTEKELECFETYPKLGTLDEVVRFFDQYAEFSASRNAPVYCGEFGCFAPFANKEERTNWYKIVTDLLEERNIARTSWDYYGPFGVFDFEKFHFGAKREKGMKVWSFPEDLNMDIIRALKLNDTL